MQAILSRIAALILILAAFASEAVLAHAALVSTQPADGVVLRVAPQRIALTFNEPVTPITFAMTGPDGVSKPMADYRVVGSQILIEKLPQLADGTHTLSWRVVSEDGHPIGGALVFSVGASFGNSGASGKAAAVADRPLQLAIWLARLALYVGLFFGIGGFFFEAWFARVQARHDTLTPTTAALAIGILAALLSFPLQGADALASGLSGAVKATAWSAAWRTSYASTLMAGGGMLLFCLMSRILHWPLSRWLSALALAGTGVALALSGHASTAPPQILTRPAVFVHTVAVAIWVGGLPPLAILLAQGRSNAVLALDRFSRVIPFVVLALVSAGATLALAQLDRPSDLLETQYGRVLTLKLALVILLLAVAAFNRFLWTETTRTGDASARRSLVQAVLAETALVALVLGTVATWRFTPPPRSLDAAVERQAPPIFAHAMDASLMAMISFERRANGSFTVGIALEDLIGKTVAAKGVVLRLSNPSRGIEAISRNAVRGDAESWTIDGLTLPVLGSWKVAVEALISDFQESTIETEVNLTP